MADSNLAGLTQSTTPAGSDTKYRVTSGSADRRILAGDDNLLPEGLILNGHFSVTVSSNNLTVALKTKSGSNPSTTDPVSIWLNGSFRRCTATLSKTFNAGTNWANLGASETATKEVDLFLYAIWNTTPGTDIFDIGWSRIPYGRLYSDFSGTNTNEKYLGFANASTPTSTDNVAVIGRFAATLSAGAGYTWTVPTYTNSNFIAHPIYETRLLDFVPTVTPSAGSRSSISNTALKYQVIGRNFNVFIYTTWTQDTTAADYVQFTLPFTPSVGPNFSGVMTGAAVTSSNVTSSTNSVFVRRYDGAAAVFTTGASKDVRMSFLAAMP